MCFFYSGRTERRLPRLGLHLDRGGECSVGNPNAKDLVEVAVEVTRFVHDRRVDRGGQHRYCDRQVLQADVGRSIMLFQGLVVWGKLPRKRFFVMCLVNPQNPMKARTYFPFILKFIDWIFKSLF